MQQVIIVVTVIVGIVWTESCIQFGDLLNYFTGMWFHDELLQVFHAHETLLVCLETVVMHEKLSSQSIMEKMIQVIRKKYVIYTLKFLLELLVFFFSVSI
jgi:hypothetical protein